MRHVHRGVRLRRTGTFLPRKPGRLAEPGEDGTVSVQSSTQHPSEIQAVISHVLHVARHKVVVVSPRMGGGFGGKETQGNTWAALAALAALKNRPTRTCPNSTAIVDMRMTGKRHPFLATVPGRPRTADGAACSRCACELICQRRLVARSVAARSRTARCSMLDNAYYIPQR